MIELPVPPLDEQKGIVKVLAADHAKTSKLREELVRSMALLKERRAALITAAVTGQIEV